MSILDRLRGDHVCCGYTCNHEWEMQEAADEIERLRAALRVAKDEIEHWSASEGFLPNDGVMATIDGALEQPLRDLPKPSEK